MDGTRPASDFSIEHILSSNCGHSAQPTPESLQNHRYSPEGYFQRFPNRFHADCCQVGASLMAPVTVMCPLGRSSVTYYGMALGNSGLFSYGGYGLHPTAFYPNHAVHTGLLRDTGAPGYPQAEPAAPARRQKSRLRTVFTSCQNKQLEALFDVTDYPAVDARAVLARNTGLAEETVRVWFKNRRARRKRQRSGSHSKSPSPVPSSKEVGTESALPRENPFSVFL